MKNYLDHRIIYQSIKLKKNRLNWYFNIIRLSFILVVIISFSRCNSSGGKENSEKQQKLLSSITDSSLDSASDSNKYIVIMPTHSIVSFQYDLDNPDERYVLPGSLTEISGLAYYKENKILCVQDEKAIIYVYNLDKKEIESEYDFGKDGDYEGITLSGQTAYVIRSDGNIFEVESFDEKDRKVKEYKTLLSAKNDAEGLTYDKLSNSLFIACKGSPSVEKEKPYEGYKAIYQFDLEKMILDKEPNFLVDLNRLDSYKNDDLFKEFSLRIAKKLQLIESGTSFQPSGLAIHPIHDEIYLLSNTGKMLIILDRQGRVMDVQDLNIKISRQPEGICFSPSGDLFISNEGDGGKGYILKFNLHTNE